MPDRDGWMRLSDYAALDYLVVACCPTCLNAKRPDACRMLPAGAAQAQLGDLTWPQIQKTIVCRHCGGRMTVSFRPAAPPSPSSDGHGERGGAHSTPGR